MLLIHGGEAIASGTTGSGATFVDSGNTGHTVTENGNAQRETEQEFKFADDGVGYFLDGTGDYLSIPDHADWDCSSSDLPVEAFIYTPESIPSNHYGIFNQHVDNDNRVQFNYADSGGLQIFVKSAASVLINLNQGDLPAHKWNHVAFVRDGNEWYLYINGVNVGNTTASITMPNLAIEARVGHCGAGAGDFKGYMDEIRVSTTARYPSGTGFIPTTTQFTSDANTVLLIHGGETKSGTTGSGATFTDSGDTGHTVTENGNAIESTGNLYKF